MFNIIKIILYYLNYLSNLLLDITCARYLELLYESEIQVKKSLQAIYKLITLNLGHL